MSWRDRVRLGLDPLDLLSGAFGTVHHGHISYTVFINTFNGVEGSSGSVGAAGSDEGSGMSDSEANLSEYEEQIRRNRELPDPHAGSSSAVPIVSSRLRKNSSATTPIVSPRHEPSPFLDQGDYGICLEDDESHDSKDYLMTTDLISKVSIYIPNPNLSYSGSCMLDYRRDGG